KAAAAVDRTGPLDPALGYPRAGAEQGLGQRKNDRVNCGPRRAATPGESVCWDSGCRRAMPPRHCIGYFHDLACPVGLAAMPPDQKEGNARKPMRLRNPKALTGRILAGKILAACTVAIATLALPSASRAQQYTPEEAQLYAAAKPE